MNSENIRLDCLSDKVSVILVDDHAMILPGLKSVVESDGRFVVTDEATDGITAVSLVLKKLPHIVLLDLSIPGLNGFEVAQRLRAEKCGSKIIFLTTYTEDRYIRMAMDVQASGYILKDNPPSELLEALNTVADGFRFFTPKVMTRLLDKMDMDNCPEKADGIRSVFDTSTPRELEIIRLIVKGMKGREICSKLGISESTLKTHKSHILKKLNLTTTRELIIYAMENDIFTNPQGSRL